MGHAYTEEEAGSKWCPESRVAASVEVHQGLKHAAGVNRKPGGRDPFDGSRCVGSLCAHWQFLSGTRNANKRGYCGLSGPPAT